MYCSRKMILQLQLTAINFNFSAVDTDPREGNTKFCGRYFGNGNNKAAADVVSRCSKF